MGRFTILVFALSTAAQGALVFTGDKKELDQKDKPLVFLDPHNHSGGILRVTAVIDPIRFISGEEPSDTEYKDFWFNFVNFYKGSPLEKNSDIANGTKLILNCNEPSLDCSRYAQGKSNAQVSNGQLIDPKCMSSLLNGIYNVLTSTPLTSFETAYTIRRKLKKMPDRAGKISADEVKRAKILDLAKTGVGLVELSQSFIGGSKGPGSTAVFSAFKEMLHDLKSKKTSLENQPLKNQLEELGLPVPEIKWLLMTNTLEFGQISDATTTTYSTGQCEDTKMPQNLITDPKTGLYDTLVQFDEVVGVDVAGPEVTCFTSFGMDKFKNLAKTTYEASKARREKGNMGKMVVRVHVGEGAPIFDTPYIADQKASCEEAKIFPQAMRVNGPDSEYVHQKESHRNISQIISAIEQLKKEISDSDEYIIFRLGHLTHLTNDQAKLLKKYGITADANLSSNISTQALTVDRSIIDEYLVKKGITANKVRDLLSALIENGAPVGKIFEHHGLRWLLYYDVPTILGTDGEGVEHTPSLAYEYQLAEKLIKYWSGIDADFKKRDISVDNLLRNQQLHYDAMGYQSQK